MAFDFLVSESIHCAASAGRVPVRVLGPVRTGDVLVSSGLHDGLARVTKPGAMPLATRPRSGMPSFCTYSGLRHVVLSQMIISGLMRW